jgi:hypothetical protein
MVLKDEAIAPRDLQQLHDLKYRTEGKSATNNGNNVADDILNVLSMAKDHPFIQKVEQFKNNVSSIILYNYEQTVILKSARDSPGTGNNARRIEILFKSNFCRNYNI